MTEHGGATVLTRTASDSGLRFGPTVQAGSQLRQHQPQPQLQRELRPTFGTFERTASVVSLFAARANRNGADDKQPLLGEFTEDDIEPGCCTRRSTQFLVPTVLALGALFLATTALVVAISTQNQLAHVSSGGNNTAAVTLSDGSRRPGQLVVSACKTVLWLGKREAGSADRRQRRQQRRSKTSNRTATSTATAATAASSRENGFNDFGDFGDMIVSEWALVPANNASSVVSTARMSRHDALLSAACDEQYPIAVQNHTTKHEAHITCCRLAVR